jgi:hypothetical protein
VGGVVGGSNEEEDEEMPEIVVASPSDAESD